MKKFIAFLTTLFILLCTTFTAFAGDLPYVVDDACLMSNEQAELLEERLDNVCDELCFDIVVVTVDSTEGKTAEAFADDYFDYNGYGYGESHDGCLLLISMEDREWHISTTGYGIYALTDAGIEYISGEILPFLSGGDYYVAFDTFVDLVVDFVNHSYEGEPYDIGNLVEYDDTYYEDYDTGFDFGTVLIAGVIGGVVFTLIIISIMKGKMKTVYHRAQANDYLVNNSLQLTGQHDLFVTSHVTKVARKSESSGDGSSTHTGSSGTSHGGGGGHF